MSSIACPQWAELTTRSGTRLHVRAVAPDDEPVLAALFAHVTPEDLRFRFLTALRVVNPAQIHGMTAVDHARSETFLAFVEGHAGAIGAAMVVGDEKEEAAEVAISIDADFKGKGFGWTLLEHAADFARKQGYRKLQSIESRENHAAIELERDMGFTARPYPGDATLVLIEAVL